MVNLNTFCPNLTFKNRYITSKNVSIGRLFVTPLISEIAKKLGKILKYTPTFKVLSAPLIIYPFSNSYKKIRCLQVPFKFNPFTSEIHT